MKTKLKNYLEYFGSEDKLVTKVMEVKKDDRTEEDVKNAVREYLTNPGLLDLENPDTDTIAEVLNLDIMALVDTKVDCPHCAGETIRVFDQTTGEYEFTECQRVDCYYSFREVK